MADNAFVKIGTALLKHQVKKLVGEEALGAIGEELADIGGDKLDAWIGEQATVVEIEKAADTARDLFRGKMNDDEVEQWMVMLPIHDLPAVLSAIEELPTSPDETKLENALRESIALNWKRLSAEQVNNAVAAFMSCLRSALLPIEKQTLMVIGRSVLRTEDKVNQLLNLVENLQAANPDTSHLKPDTPKWFYGHRYGDLENFTGRAAEMQMLDEWLGNDKDNLLVLTAFGGFGKSALTWQWFNNRVDKTKWQTAVWWSFYEKESGFESFLAETLAHLGVEVKASARSQLNDLLEAMRGTEILIVLDGFERLLRQYGRMDAALQSDDEDAAIDPAQRDCSSPLTETFLRGLSGAGLKSKVLLTTRLCPRVLESADGKLLKGCREAPLAAFSPEDAVTYFHNEGIKATRAEIVAACSTYGYHPLSLSLLVGLINEDHEKRGDIEAVKNLEIFEDVRARRHHVLERAYESLAPERRDLLSKISCFRGSMEYAVLKKVFPSPDLDKALLDLRKRGLLQYAGESQRYDMHPIVRRYSYERLADKVSVHNHLMKYFSSIPEPDEKDIHGLEDLTSIIERYYQTVRAGLYDEAYDIFYARLNKPLYYRFGAYQAYIELQSLMLSDSENQDSFLSDIEKQADILNDTANAYTLSGQPRRAVPLVKMVLEIDERYGNKEYASVSLSNLATQQILLGEFAAAELNLQRRVELCREIKDEFLEAEGHMHLGRLFAYMGLFEQAEKELKIAQVVYDSFGVAETNFVSVIRAYYGWAKLIEKDVVFAHNIGKQALDMALSESRSAFAGERDVIRAEMVAGTALINLALGEQRDETMNEANILLTDALSRSYRINLAEFESSILVNLARLNKTKGSNKVARELAEEALTITERSGYVLQGADVNLFLAQYALEQEKDKAKAKVYAEEAKKLATCDGPPYYYKVAYEEAERLLARLKE